MRFIEATRFRPGAGDDRMPLSKQRAPQGWTCANCAVEVSWAGPPEQRKLPATWIEDDRGPICLHCRRELAADAAVSASELNLQGRARLRASTIVEFEVRRAPDRTNSQIANAAHTSVGVVRKARDRIDATALA